MVMCYRACIRHSLKIPSYGRFTVTDTIHIVADTYEQALERARAMFDDAHVESISEVTG